ncbi:hypothetical protein [Saccharothrix sp. ST-888]|uniref:hypothetical protein n=1 Tax=Saccharothrix sp. ST-888 TaxID=1427391 RepID=UPI000A882CF3|nr:hypothetical protein [Saccharothrix sp. ST-888]
MSVHIGEIHTDVVPAGAPAEQRGGGQQPAERLPEALAHAEWLRARVAAEGFDD